MRRASEQEVPQLQLALVGAVPLQQEAERREAQRFRLLAHDEVDQHRDADQHQTAQE